MFSSSWKVVLFGFVSSRSDLKRFINVVIVVVRVMTLVVGGGDYGPGDSG